MNNLHLAMFGTTELVITLFIILILFGANKIPQIMKGFGKGVKNFKDEINSDEEKNIEEKND